MITANERHKASIIEEASVAWTEAVQRMFALFAFPVCPVNHWARKLRWMHKIKSKKLKKFCVIMKQILERCKLYGVSPYNFNIYTFTPYNFNISASDYLSTYECKYRHIISTFTLSEKRNWPRWNAGQEISKWPKTWFHCNFMLLFTTSD